MKVLFDMASVIQTGLRKGESKDYIEVQHEGKTVKVNTAAHGYENAVGYMVAVLDMLKLHPVDAIMVFEGKDSKKRRMQLMATYKGKREKSAPEYYVEYNKCKSDVKRAFRDVGALALTQDFAEGDDTLKFLAENLDEDVVVVSNDGDLAVLAGTNRRGHKVSVMAGSEYGKLPEGVYEPRHVTLYKALVGDTYDYVKGSPGFGQAKWDELLMKYGGDGIDEIAAAINSNDVNTITKFAQQNKCKLLSKIVDTWNQVRQCWRVVTIYSDWVNTRYHPLKWEPGMVKSKGADERLHKFAQASRLVTADNYDAALAFLKKTVAENPGLPVAFDLETSSTGDSDDWMEGQGRPDGVDPQGSYIVGFSMTFGKGGRNTYYVSVKHFDTKNITMKQAREMIEVIHDCPKPIHNTAFELVLLYNDFAKDEDGTLWRDAWKDKGEFGMLPNIDDTLFMASYVDENAISKGLKNLSKNVLDYEQVDFNSVRTRKLENGEKPWPGGRIVERTLMQPKLEDGKPVYDAKGKQKMEAAKEEKVLLDENGAVVTKRKRNPETKLMEDVPKTVKVPVMYKEVVYKMHEMPATAVFSYGADDTICTMAYYNFAKLHMLIDEHLHVYREVEIDAAYLHAKNFYDGFPINVSEVIRQKNNDKETLLKAEEILFAYLVTKGWKGTVRPVYTKDITPAEVKEAYATVFGLAEEDEEDEDSTTEKDAILAMKIRTPAKIVELIQGQDREGAEMFAWQLEQLYKGEERGFNDYVGQFFTGRPKFAFGNKDKSKLLYETLGATVKVRNKVTPKMREAGIREGTPKADALAIAYAIMEMRELGKKAEEEVLEALRLITMVHTRQGLYYEPYPSFVHWHDGKVHSSHRQCHANTRRASSAAPNMQQMSVHEKIEGYASEFRRVVEPHKVGAVVVSMDFNAQELRVIADDSQDPNMLACYVGNNRKDMHSITASSIAFEKKVAEMITAYNLSTEENKDERLYKSFVSLKSEHAKLFGELRSLGKKVNFTTEYGAMAPKLAATLMVSEEEAQMFIDAREAAFAVAAQWKAEKLVKIAKEQGFIRSRKGAKRHLAEMFDSGDRMVSSKAERQSVNYRIQGSCAEMTKLAEGRMWRAGLFSGKYDAVCYGPIHDEVVASVMLSDLKAFLADMHTCMVAPYADMQVPIVSSIEVGYNMYDMYEFGESADWGSIKKETAKALEKAMAKNDLDSYNELKSIVDAAEAV